MIEQGAPDELMDHPESPRGDTSKLEARQLWEAEERIAELEARLAEHLERQRVREVEIAALRSDLAVKAAYSSALEQAAGERQGQVEWLQSRFDAEQERARASAAELAAERARISYRIVQRLLSAVRPHRPS